MNEGDYAVLTNSKYNGLPLYIVQILWIDFEGICSVRTIMKINGIETKGEHISSIEMLKPLNYLKRTKSNHET